jgi:hypothetical protein
VNAVMNLQVLLTICSRILLEALLRSTSSVVTKSPTFYGTRKFMYHKSGEFLEHLSDRQLLIKDSVSSAKGVKRKLHSLK